MKWFKSLLRGRPKMSFEEVVGFYRELGFFQDRPSETVPETARRLADRFKAEWGKSPNPNALGFDKVLLTYDEDRVWADDPEADVGCGNEVYVRVLPQWSFISLGCFRPTDIREVWHSQKGPVEVLFQLEGQQVKLSPKYLDDYIDIEGVLTQINRLIAHTGRRFECLADVNFATVFLINEADRERLISVRGLEFAWSKRRRGWHR